MAINRIMLAAIKALSYTKEYFINDYQAERKLDAVLYPRQDDKEQRTWERRIIREGYSIPLRLFFPEKPDVKKMLVYIHGGGFVKGNNDTYSSICANLANHMEQIVMAVDYRLAPEHRFPVGLEDCYYVVQQLLQYPHLYGVEAEDITLIGDSAGANLIAALSLMARDKQEKQVLKQILIYPLTYNDHTEYSPYASVRENGQGYVLTMKRINEYVDLYIQNQEDFNNKYFAPLLAQDLSQQPETLVITAEYDLLRDEGEAYAEQLKEAGNQVTLYRVQDAIHGYFSLPPSWDSVKETYSIIKSFLIGR